MRDYICIINYYITNILITFIDLYMNVLSLYHVTSSNIYSLKHIFSQLSYYVSGTTWPLPSRLFVAFLSPFPRFILLYLHTFLDICLRFALAEHMILNSGRSASFSDIIYLQVTTKMTLINGKLEIKETGGMIKEECKCKIEVVSLNTLNFDDIIQKWNEFGEEENNEEMITWRRDKQEGKYCLCFFLDFMRGTQMFKGKKIN